MTYDYSHKSRYATILTKVVSHVNCASDVYQIGFLGDKGVSLPAVSLMLRRATLQGVSVGHRRAFEDMNRAIDRLGIKPVTDSEFVFADVSAAFDCLEQGPFGKVVIQVSK